MRHDATQALASYCELALTRAGGLALVRTYVRKTEWNRTVAFVRDPFSIRAMSVQGPFNGRSISVQFPKTVDRATEGKR